MTLDAKIRIAADTAQAAKALRDVEAAGKSAKAALEADKSKASAIATAADDLAFYKTRSGDAIKAAKDFKSQSDATTESLKQQRNQARLLGPQLTDIFVGLTTGQSPFTVLLQQGGQLKDVFGGVGNAFKAVTSIFTLGRVAIGGVVAVVGGLLLLLKEGSDQSRELAKSIGLVGNVADLVSGQLDTMTERIAVQQNAAAGDVRQILGQLVATGQYTATTLEAAGRAAASYQKVTGATSEESIKQFADMGTGVAAWAEKANRSYNFLTVAQFKQIQSLQAQGKTQDAMRIALDAFNAKIESRAVPTLGSLEKAWNSVKTSISGALQAVRDFGKDDGPSQALDRINKKLAELQKQIDYASKNPYTAIDLTAALKAQQDKLNAEKAGLQAQADAEKKAADDEAAAAAETQKKIEDNSKSRQDAQTQVVLANVQQRLAAQLAAQDRLQSAAESRRARDVVDEEEYSQKLNEIDQARAQAELTALLQRRKIEGGRTVVTPEDTAARNAAVAELSAQIIEQQSKIQGLVESSTRISIDNVKRVTEEWTQLWQQAYQKARDLATENAAAAAQQIADPVAKATEQARQSTEQLRNEIEALKRQLTLQLDVTLDPIQAAQLKRQIAELTAGGDQAAANRGAASRFASLQQSFTDLDTQLQLQEAALATAVEQGALTTVEAEKRKFAARAESLPQLETILKAMQAIATTAADRNAVEGLIQEVQKLRGEASELDKTFRSAATSSLTQFFNDTSTGAKTTKQALLDMVGSFSKSMLNLLNQRLSEKLVKQFEDSIGNNGSGFLGFLAGLFGSSGSVGAAGKSSADLGSLYSSTGYGHTGAIIGESGGWKQSAPLAAFVHAPRYHGGGVLGLAPNEVPFVGEIGEEVLTKNDPRHARNFGGSVGDINIGVTVSGADGSNDDKQSFGDELAQRIRAVTMDVIGEQKRQGGLLAAGR